jgi:hypothetical protein
MKLRIPVLVSALLAACQPKVTVGESYSLELLPHLPLDQVGDGPLQGSDLTLRVTQGGDTTSHALGPAASAQWSAVDIGALDQATIGLLWTEPDATDDPLVYDSVRAWGLSPAVTIDSGATRLPVMVGAFGVPGQFGALDGADIPLGGAAVRLDNGDVLIFGGTDDVIRNDGDDDLNHKASTAVLRLRVSDDALTFQKVGDMPKVASDSSIERVGATATLVTVDGKTQVLVVGGRATWANPAVLKAGAFLWDPESDTATWTGTTQSDGRFLGGAEPFPDGRIAVFGGFDTQTKASFSWQIFDPVTQSFDQTSAHSSSIEVGAVGAAWVNLGDSGILICGGATSVVSGPLIPTATCAILGPNGDTLQQSDIGGAAQNTRMWAAMTQLADGKILLTGGIDSPVGEGAATAAPALPDAYLLDLTSPSPWTPLPPMNHARAMHRLITRPDGRVLALGGLSQGTSVPVVDQVPTPASCGEVFDPAANTWTDLAICDTVGAGGLPLVATAPGYGAFVLTGFTPTGGGQDWGIVPLGPTP